MNRPTPFLISLAGLLTTASSALAGNLNPPPGAVTPTGRFGPRTEINATNTPGDADSLFKITQPGSYYLGGNLTGVAAKHGIEIASDSVSIDLEGFELRGIPGSLDGIRTDVPRKNLAIRNGTVTMWGQDGIDFSFGGAGIGSLIESVHASLNGSRGIVGNTRSVIRACTTTENADNGIDVFGQAVVLSCVSTDNGRNGIFCGSPTVIRGCLAVSNVTNGILVTTGSSVANCSALVNGANGIEVFEGSSVTHCSAAFNGKDGIKATDSSVIDSSSSSFNTGDGIRVQNDCHVRMNTCDSNGNIGDGAGVHATGSDNRIESNNVTDNDRGIDVDVTGSLIIANSASGNTTDYDLIAGNTFGTVLNFPAGGAIISNVIAGNGFNLPNAWSNVIY